MEETSSGKKKYLTWWRDAAPGFVFAGGLEFYLWSHGFCDQKKRYVAGVVQW
ncbi:MAG: hypothetical protein OEZ58_18820 [Gammaproteobacteria bacterium]|nr:hypothetical protein [Gammaproteobacteria bacterium]MDH5731043.1 hypothetical protein [Gammaproteobacteria bacterium]